MAANAAAVTQLEKALHAAESWEDLQLLLAEHLGGDLGPDQLEDLLAEMMLASTAYGRAAVQGEEA